MWLVKTGKRQFATALVLLACVIVPAALASNANANPAVRGQSLTIYPGGGSSQAKGDAYGAERVDARLYYGGAYRSYYGCYRSTWSVHLWVCNLPGVPVGYSAFAEVAYYNANGWSYGYTPWVYSSCCESHTAVSGVIG